MEISQWTYDKLKETEKEYYKLLKEKEDLIKALKPFIKEIIEEVLNEDK